ncbi:hypothetical protein D3C78_1685440 [compost metagenome]
MKSVQPRASAAARKGVSAPPASGNAGARGDSGPVSRISRLTMPRAGRPVNRLVSAVVSAWGLRKAARWAGATLASGVYR